MASNSESNSTLLVSLPDKLALPSVAEITAELESTDPNKKISALKKTIMLVLSGEEMPRVMMTVIRYCITVENHALQKVLMLYYECVRKYDSAGKLLPEMILVCNAMRNNLLHPNEYIRGATLRFLCKLREPEILEPLVPAVKQCLTHRHPYVRRNAVLTVFSIVRQFPDLYPDAVDDVDKFLEDEADAGARRNAFVMLFGAAQDKAIAYLTRNMDKVLNYGDGFALILLELIRKLARAGGGDVAGSGVKAKFIRIVFALLENPSPAVAFEAASTLVSLSSAPTAVRAVSGTYIKILTKESDNNVKLIVLERLSSLRKRHARILREQVMDLLRVLSHPNTDIRRKTLEVAMDLVSPRNVEEVMALLKKEVLATSAVLGSSSATASGSGGATDPEAVAYRGMLISAIHGCAVRFPEVASNVVHLLLDFLSGEGALYVVEFVREIVETFPDMRAAVLVKLRDVAADISASEVHRVALWILGQYSESEEEVTSALHTIRECIGPLPLTVPFVDYAANLAAAAAAAAEKASGLDDGAGAAAATRSSRPVVLADGTYATQSGLTETGGARGGRMGGGGGGSGDLEDTPVPPLRKLLLAGDFYLGSVVASTLTKLALRVTELNGGAAGGGRDARASKAVLVDSMLVMCSMIELGGSGLAGTPTLLPVSLMPPVSGRTYGSTRPPPPPPPASPSAAPAPGAPAVAGSNAPALGGPAPGTPGGLPTGGAPVAVAPSLSGVRIDQDSFERIVLCMRVLGDPAASAATLPILLGTCRDTFHNLLNERRARAAQALKDGIVAAGAGAGVSFAAGVGSRKEGGGGGEGEGRGSTGNAVVVHVRADETPAIRQLRGKGGGASAPEEYLMDDSADVDAATGAAAEDFAARLKRIHQLTGFADPIYCEAFVKVHEFDIVLELLVINRTDTTLTNVMLELSVMGDLKLVERPPMFTLGPRDSRTLEANVKVASTETGHIFGTIAYNTPTSPNDQVVVNLAEIHVDIMDYIHPATCSDAAFRSMWADFEWENKVSVNTNHTRLHDFVRHIARNTNMRILTPLDALPNTVSFLAANLYARSTFGEDALVNVSVENKPDGAIRGHIRIRAKTQGVALSLGDRLTAKQKA